VQIGINQDIVFKDERFHVQTEDSGVKRPVITTTLFKGGVVVVARKINYEDRLGSEDLEKEVTELMQTLHEDVICALKKGEFEKLKKPRKQDAPVEPANNQCDSPAQAGDQKVGTKRPLKVTKEELEDKVLEFLSLDL
jgi:hypothetical protein